MMFRNMYIMLTWFTLIGENRSIMFWIIWLSSVCMHKTWLYQYPQSFKNISTWKGITVTECVRQMADVKPKIYCNNINNIMNRKNLQIIQKENVTKIQTYFMLSLSEIHFLLLCSIMKRKKKVFYKIMV